MTAPAFATDAIVQVSEVLTALPACVAGSAVASAEYNLPDSDFTDVDVFCYSRESLIQGVNLLRSAGYTVEPRFERVLHRWIKYGLNGWHTNSMKMLDPSGAEINLIYKLVNKHPLTSLAQVLESFDFGLLGIGYDLEDGTRRDMRSYLFPDHDIDGPLPLMPARRDSWRGGFISTYQGLRELGRYAKYVRRGYDLSLVKDDLITGYMSAGLYNSQRDDEQKQKLSQIYYRAAELIEDNDLDALTAAGKLMPVLDELDRIMEALE